MTCPFFLLSSSSLRYWPIVSRDDALILRSALMLPRSRRRPHWPLSLGQRAWLVGHREFRFNRRGDGIGLVIRNWLRNEREKRGTPLIEGGDEIIERDHGARKKGRKNERRRYGGVAKMSKKYEKKITRRNRPKNQSHLEKAIRNRAQCVCV